VDVMLAMAASVHAAAAPVITEINLDYMRPYFKTEPVVDGFLKGQVLEKEQETARSILSRARAEVRAFGASANSLINPFGEAVVGGSSIAVGSPTNMGRIAHELASGDIRRITIELTTDLFARRAINVPGILMGAVLGASTKDIKAYRMILKEIKKRGIVVEIKQVTQPEVQRITIEATGNGAFINALNRGGGRLKLIDAKPSLAEAAAAAARLGIKLAET
jgi:L-serine dehydratase